MLIYRPTVGLIGRSTRICFRRIPVPPSARRVLLPVSFETAADHASQAALALAVLAPNGVLQDYSHPFAWRPPAITFMSPSTAPPCRAKIDDQIAPFALSARHNGAQ